MPLTSMTADASTPAAALEPSPQTRARLAEHTACFAGLAGADALALVWSADDEVRILAHYPASTPVDVPFGLGASIDTGETVRIDSPTGMTIMQPLGTEGEPIPGAILATFSGRCPVEVTERMRQIAPLAASLLQSVLAGDKAQEVESELQRMRARLRELTRTVASGIATVDAEGQIQDINAIAADIVGLASEEAVGRNFRDFIAPEDLSLALETFANRLAGYLSRDETELHVMRPTGERRLVQVSSSPVLDGPRIVGVHFATRDITEERAREIQIRRAERLASLGPLLGGVCHELNNPLTSIKSFAELMLLDDRPAEDVEALEIVRREAARAARIVSDLKLVARQTQEDGNLGFVRLNELVARAIEGLEAETQSAGAELRLDLAPDLPQICGSVSQLERVVTQILSNALQVLEGHDGPRTIEVGTHLTRDGVGLRVRDTGPGIAPEHVERIFDPFWTTRTSGEGTGLGLSLAHTIITEHKGRISVDGGWGSGATFTVELPAGEPAPGPAPDLGVQTPARLPLRILVVDDEGPIRFTMVRYMSRRGHTVIEAEEGGKALELVAGSEPFDIILADLRMPGLGGEQLFVRLRELGRGLEQRLIFITGDAHSPDASRVVEEAGVPVVLKPFELAEIAQIIEAQAAALAAA